MKFLSKYIFILFALTTFASPLCAQTPFVSNDELNISIPSGIETEECSAELAQKAGDACIKLTYNDSRGVIFFRQNDGYALTKPGALEKHIEDSVGALSDIPNVKVLNARILDTPSRIGILDLLRNDMSVATVTELGKPPIRQTSLLIPLTGKLAQLFIYVDYGDSSQNPLAQKLFDEFPANIEVLINTQDDDTKQNVNTGIVPSGSFSLLPQALLWGGAGALVIILILHLNARRRRKQRDREDTDS